MAYSIKNNVLHGGFCQPVTIVQGLLYCFCCYLLTVWWCAQSSTCTADSFTQQYSFLLLADW